MNKYSDEGIAHVMGCLNEVRMKDDEKRKEINATILGLESKIKRLQARIRKLEDKGKDLWYIDVKSTVVLPLMEYIRDHLLVGAQVTVHGPAGLNNRYFVDFRTEGEEKELYIRVNYRDDRYVVEVEDWEAPELNVAPKGSISDCSGGNIPTVALESLTLEQLGKYIVPSCRGR